MCILREVTSIEVGGGVEGALEIVMTVLKCVRAGAHCRDVV